MRGKRDPFRCRKISVKDSENVIYFLGLEGYGGSFLKLPIDTQENIELIGKLFIKNAYIKTNKGEKKLCKDM